VEASHIRRQLGQILVEEGFLSPAQLELAIAEQHRSPRPLGQVLVELGLASAGEIASALAEQHGGLLSTEFGVSAGLRANAPALQPVEPQLRVAGLPEEYAERRRLAAELEALREQCQSLGRGVSHLASELERVRNTL
jgi:hypothetical protein